MKEVSYIPASTAQRAWWDDLYQLDRTSAGFDRIQVYETGTNFQPTGVLDAQGNELFRVIKQRPMGFTVPKEEF